MNTSKEELKESLLYLAIWVLLLCAPILSMGVRSANDSSLSFSWEEIMHEWEVIIPYLVIFLIHNYIVAPLLIYKKKKWLYLGITLCIIALFQVYQCQHQPPFKKGPMEMGMHQGGRPGEHDGPPPPWAERNDSSRAGKEDGRGPHEMRSEADGPHRPDDGGPRFMDGDKPEGIPPLDNQHDIMAMIVLILMMGANLGLKQYFKSSKDRKELEELERKNLEQQLEYLKYQINPHFFMNTLNNIHALVDIEPEEAKHSIVELSKMMRYVLYEGAKGSVPLQKDIEFLENYVSLMKLRYTDKVSINFDVSDDISNKMVPPMLFITFVENAFKHGVSYRTPSFIDIHISTTDDQLTFTCRNSKTNKEPEEQGGVGLKNTRKRLDLIYGDKYKLDINDGTDTYEVLLEIGLQ